MTSPFGFRVFGGSNHIILLLYFLFLWSVLTTFRSDNFDCFHIFLNLNFLASSDHTNEKTDNDSYIGTTDDAESYIRTDDENFRTDDEMPRSVSDEDLFKVGNVCFCVGPKQLTSNKMRHPLNSPMPLSNLPMDFRSSTTTHHLHVTAPHVCYIIVILSLTIVI